MLVDKQTLRDLGIFKAEEDSTALFDFVDKTITAGGSYCLRQKFLDPPDSLIDLKKQQETVRLLSGINETSELRLPFNTHQMKSLEEYVSSNINVIENENLLPCILFCLSDIEAYRYVRNSLFEVIRFIYSFDDFLNISENGIEMPRLLQLIKVEIAELKNDIDSVEAINLKNKNRLIFYRVLRADRIFRTRLKSKFQNIINSYSEIDALIAMAKTTSENNFHFPEIVEKEIIFHVDGLFHPLLKNPVPYDFTMDSQFNFVFLTGPNMAGKTTFLKAAGTAIYLAHLGMGIPAQSARINYFDRLLTSLNITDSIATGFSFFYSEVKRVKQLADALNKGERIFALFDELFRGTNVKDAFDASVLIISGLVNWNRSMFILSSHLWELWDEISIYSNIRELCFESKVKDGVPVFTYHILRGVSDMRLGMTIITNEKIMDLLNNKENVKN